MSITALNLVIAEAYIFFYTKFDHSAAHVAFMWVFIAQGDYD